MIMSTGLRFCIQVSNALEASVDKLVSKFILVKTVQLLLSVNIQWFVNVMVEKIRSGFKFASNKYKFNIFTLACKYVKI